MVQSEWKKTSTISALEPQKLKKPQEKPEESVTGYQWNMAVYDYEQTSVVIEAPSELRNYNFVCKFVLSFFSLEYFTLKCSAAITYTWLKF